MAIGIPSTYKVPLVGFEQLVKTLIVDIQENSNGNVIIPDPFFLTRKNAIDSLRPHFNI